MQDAGGAQSRPMMSLPDAVRQVIRKYAEFRGRATRAEFWWWELSVLIAGFALGSVDASIASFGGGNAYSPLGVVFGLATLLPGLAVSVRRLHDIGKSGWLLVGFCAAGILGWIPIAAGLTVAAINGLFDSVWSEATIVPLLLGIGIALVAWLVLVVWYVLWLARQGQTGHNRFGPDPRVLDAPIPSPADAAK